MLIEERSLGVKLKALGTTASYPGESFFDKKANNVRKSGRVRKERKLRRFSFGNQCAQGDVVRPRNSRANSLRLR